MTIRPLPGVPLDNLLGNIETLKHGISTVRATIGGAPALLDAYLRWTENAEWSLGRQLGDPDLESLIFTRRYWSIVASDPDAPRLISLIQRELDQGERSLAQEHATLLAFRDRWSGQAAIVVPDTNVFLHGAEQINRLPWLQLLQASNGIRLVLPLIVIEELDRHKLTNNRTAARAALRVLDELLSDQPGKRVRLNDSAAVTLEVLVDPLTHVRLAKPDSEIVDRALYLKDLTAGRPTWPPWTRI